MISNPRPGWRYFPNDLVSSFSHWAWDPVAEKGYWLKPTGKYCPSSLTLANWSRDIEEMVDRELELDEGI
jgi:hypothetical protein